MVTASYTMSEDDPSSQAPPHLPPHTHHRSASHTPPATRPCKRKILNDNDVYSEHRPKRMSMLHNTPRQRRDERRRILRMSISKLKSIDDPERNLCRSVLLKNTVKRLNDDKRFDKRNGFSYCSNQNSALMPPRCHMLNYNFKEDKLPDQIVPISSCMHRVTLPPPKSTPPPSVSKHQSEVNHESMDMAPHDPQPTPESAKCPPEDILILAMSQPEDTHMDVEDNMPLDLSICSSKKSHCSSPKTLIGNRHDGVDLSAKSHPNDMIGHNYALINGDLDDLSVCDMEVVFNNLVNVLSHSIYHGNPPPSHLPASSADNFGATASPQYPINYAECPTTDCPSDKVEISQNSSACCSTNNLSSSTNNISSSTNNISCSTNNLSCSTSALSCSTNNLSCSTSALPCSTNNSLSSTSALSCSTNNLCSTNNCDVAVSNSEMPITSSS